MSLSLTKRIPTGSPLTAVQNDANMTAIEAAVNANTTGLAAVPGLIAAAIAAIPPSGAFDSAMVKADPGGSGQTITANNTPVKAVLSTAAINPSGYFNTTTYEYTCPATGYYVVSASSQFDNNTAQASTLQVQLSVYVNGSNVGLGNVSPIPSPNGARWFPSFGGVPISCAVGDKITLYINVTDAVGTGHITATDIDFGVFRLSH